MYDIERIYNPTTINEALRLLKEIPEAVLLAGGTDVMIRLKHRKLKKANLIYIREIEELTGVYLKADGTIVIRPGTCFDDIYRNEICRKHIPILSHACNTVGSPQIRNIGTIGGNLCNGAVSADSVPSLYVLDAELVIKNADGERIVPVTQFHTGPGRTILERNEILTEIRIRKASYENYGGCYIKIGQRNSMEISTLGCAAAVRLDREGQNINDVRIAFGVAGPVPIRTRDLERALKGKAVDDSLYSFISLNVLNELNPRDSWRASKELREQLIRTLSVRAVKKAIEDAGGARNA